MEEPQVGDLVEIVITGRVTDKSMEFSRDPKRPDRVLTIKTDAAAGECGNLIGITVRFDSPDVVVRQLQAR
jgi:hypothetical protein